MLETLDDTITLWFNAGAGNSPFADTTAILISGYGVPLMILAVALQWFLKQEQAPRRHALLSSGFAFLLGLAFNQVILLFIHRMRPYDAGLTNLIIEKSADWSFPSDHATASVAIAISFLFLGYRKQSLGFGIAAALVCWSRLHVGIHYAGDIAGGAITGALAAALIPYLYRPTSRLNQIVVRIL